jgi:hypothetical protein
VVGWKGIIKAAGQSEINGNTKVAGRRVMTEQDIKTKHIISMPRGWIRRKKGSIKAAYIDMERNCMYCNMERKHEGCFSIWKQRKHKAAGQPQ